MLRHINKLRRDSLLRNKMAHKKNMFESVKVKRLKDYPFETNTKKPYFVEIYDGNMTFIEGFDKKSDAIAFAKKQNAKTKRVYLN